MNKQEAINLFNYKDGALYWKVRVGDDWQTKRFNQYRAGKPCASEKNGYKVISHNGKQYLEHRLIWIIHNDEISGIIDHINQNKSDNRIDNLKLSNYVENGRNRKLGANNKSGVIGVFFSIKRNKWKAQIKVMGKSKSLGYYSSLFEAACARKSQELTYSFSKNHSNKQCQA